MSTNTSTAQASMEFLSSADDLLTRLLLDYSIFCQDKLGGRSTAKINRFARELRMSDQEVDQARAFVKELRKGTTSVDASLDTLLAFPSVRAFNKKWEEEGMFANHAKRYILALRPDSGIAFHEVDRYKNPQAAAGGGGGGAAGAKARGKRKALPAVAAAVARKDPEATIELGTFATRPFKKGEVLHLRGGLADLTDEQDDELRGAGGRSDFSVLWSQRKQCFSLLLGPASKVNHDCRNNVEFQLNGAHMTFKVIEDIAKDEELFTHYGEHYFEQDNASCLCATCEQLEKGAFTPAAAKQPKKEPKPTPAPSNPSRRSGRAVAAVNYDENLPAPVASTSGHAVTAQRSLRGGLSRSSSLSSLSSLSSSDSSRPTSPARGARSRTAPSRINPSRISAIDLLRSQPRTVVQVKLPPPPGYRTDYVWDAKKKLAKYVGPTICPADEVSHKRKPTTGLSRSTSAPSRLHTLGKRTRAASDSPQPKSRTRNADGESRPKRPRQSLTKLPPARMGERSSKRNTSATASARERAFEKLRRAMGGEEDDEESDLSELEESAGDEEEEGEKAGESELTDVEEEGEDASEEEAKEVEAMLSPVRRRSISRVEETPLPFAMPGLSYATPAAAPVASTSTSIATAAVSVVATRSTRSTRSTVSAEVTSAPGPLAVDITMSTSTPAEETFSPSLHAPSSHGEEDVEAEEGILLCEVPTVSKADDSTPHRSSPRRPITTPSFYSSSAGAAALDAAEDGSGEANGSASSAGQSGFCVAPSAAGGGNTRLPTGVGDGGGGGGGLGGGAGGGDDPRRNGGRDLHLPVDKMDVEVEVEEEKPKVDANSSQGKGGEAAAAEEPVVEDSEDAAAALLMLLSAPLSNTSARTPSSTAPTPPTNESSAASTSTEASTSTFDLDAASAKKQGKRKRLSNESQPSPPPASSLNPRSTRRQPKLDSAPTPPPEPEAELPADDVKGKKAIKRARIAESPAAPSTSTSRRRSIAEPESASKPEARRTRGSHPLPGTLADVLYAPETLASLGGYDFEKGRYISKHEAIRSPSNDPRPKPRSPSPSPSPSPPPPSRKATSSSAKPISLPSKRSRLSYSPATSTLRTPGASSRLSSAATTSRRNSLPGPSDSTPSVAPPDGVRSTRGSFPIAQRLQDLIYSPAVLAASGGYDAEKGVYVSAASAAASAPSPGPSTSSRRASSAGLPLSSSQEKKAKRPLSASPAAALPASSSAPPEGTRSTRRSFPMAGTKLQDLVHGEAARSASGGWDPVKGRYVGRR
ncbi:hypothetical protein JCM6882_000788 [Rhodosporidiobolus microsporus]